MFQEDVGELKYSEVDAAPKVESSHDSNVGLTQKQYQNLVSLFQQSNLQVLTPSHQILTSNISTSSASNPPSNSGNTFILSCQNLVSSPSWILDLAATNHVCSSLTYFASYSQINLVQVRLLNNLVVLANYAGKVCFSPSLVLSHVVYIPDFKFNLILVSKLSFSLNCSLIFSANHCHI